MTDPGTSAWLSEEDWAWAQDHLPIACVDVLPVDRSQTGVIQRIGLIRRDSPMGMLWCHVGGRVNVGESTFAGAARHLERSLSNAGALLTHPEPYFVNEFFRDRRPASGYDPRKHSMAACYLAELRETTSQVIEAIGTEAVDFRWFALDDLPGVDELWPGTDIMIERALELLPREHDVELDLASYQAIADRNILYNQLMWQSPALAMTAMAFLLTIALSRQPDWMRVVAAILSTVVALISAQLLAKHSEGELADAERLERIELRRGLVHAHKRHPYGLVRPSHGLRRWAADRKSRDWWWRALLFFAAVSFAIAVAALFSA